MLDAEIVEKFHLRQTLQGGLFGFGFGIGEFGRCDIAEGEAGVIVRGTDDAVEVDLESLIDCRAHGVIPGLGFAGRASVGVSIEAMG